MWVDHKIDKEDDFRTIILNDLASSGLSPELIIKDDQDRVDVLSIIQQKIALIMVY